MGAFIQSDPKGLWGGSYSTFAYVNGSPAMATDRFGLAELTDDIWDAGLIDTIRGNSQASRAGREAALTGYRGQRNGPRDALRHCIWLCLMVQNINEEDASEIGENHEENAEKLRPPQPREEGVMDRHNNMIGVQCGLEENPLSCRDRCLRRYHMGQLHGLGRVPLPPPVRR
jgi:hypothetical protein